MPRKEFYISGSEIWVTIKVDAHNVVDRPANHAELDEYEAQQREELECQAVAEPPAPRKRTRKKAKK